MGRGNYLGGHTILFGGQFGPEGKTIPDVKRYKNFTENKEQNVGAAERRRPSPPPTKPKLQKKQALKGRVAKEFVKLDKFSFPDSLMTEGIPGPTERSHYFTGVLTCDYFQRVKNFMQATSKNGAIYLSDYLISMNDSGLKTLKGSRWTRQLISGLIYDIRHESSLPRIEHIPPSAPKPAVKQAPKIERMRPTKLKPSKEEIQRLDQDRILNELRNIEDSIRDLENAWDAAMSDSQRQKIRDQLESKRRKRIEIFHTLAT